MKYYGIFLVVICIVTTVYGLISSDAIDFLRNHQNECIRETGTSENDVEYTKQYGKFCDDGHMDKFAVCMLQKFNIIMNDGSVNQDTDSYAHNLVTDDPESLDKVKQCTHIPEEHHLRRARKIINCILDSNVYVFDPRPRKHN